MLTFTTKPTSINNINHVWQRKGRKGIGQGRR
jgi:hypothetical protein